jgi:hypothetical protein
LRPRTNEAEGIPKADAEAVVKKLRKPALPPRCNSGYNGRGCCRASCGCGAPLWNATPATRGDSTLPRCGSAHCPDHGDDPAVAGARALRRLPRPLNATPSGAVFRVSLVGLFVASVLALWLLIRPPLYPASRPRNSTAAHDLAWVALPTESSPPPSPVASAGYPPEATPAPTVCRRRLIQYTMQEETFIQRGGGVGSVIWTAGGERPDRGKQHCRSSLAT